MANHLYRYNPRTYSRGATTTSLYFSRSITDSYLSAEASLFGSSFRYLSADSLSSAAAISSSMLYNSDSYSTRVPGVSVTTPTHSYGPPGVDLGPTIATTDSLFSGLKRTSSDYVERNREQEPQCQSAMDGLIDDDSMYDSPCDQEKYFNRNIHGKEKARSWHMRHDRFVFIWFWYFVYA